MEITFNPERIGVERLNSLQLDALELQSSSKDVILLAPTGSGKTLAYALLVKESLAINLTTQVLIVVPTRELAQQIELNFKALFPTLFTTSVHGGVASSQEKRRLLEFPSIIIGTPGRVIHHLEEGNIQVRDIHTLILDEYDKSLELGFKDQIEEISQFLPENTRKLLVSATQLKSVPGFLNIEDTAEINHLQARGLAPRINVTELKTPAKYKIKALSQLFQNYPVNKTLVFCNHREAVERVSESLEREGIEHDIFHGKLNQQERELSLFKFSNQSTRILVTTDLASRGLDITDVELIIHYQLPISQETFTHRNGRTARVDKRGRVILLTSSEDKRPDFLRNIKEEEINIEEYDPTSVPSAEFCTLRLNLGKKQKIRKIDVVGYFLSFDSVIAKDQLGQIMIKDNESFLAVPLELAKRLIELTKEHKIKGKKVKVSLV